MVIYMRFKDYASLVGDIKEVNFDKVAMRDNDFTLENEMPISWLELNYISLRKDCETINKAKNTLRYDKEFDITPLREQENKYKFILKVLEREIYNDTKEQDKALELLKSLEGKTLGMKEQRQLLIDLRSIYDRTLPTESDLKKHGLSRWLLYLRDCFADQDIELYYSYKGNEETSWNDLVISFEKIQKKAPLGDFHFDINKNGLPF